MREVWPRVRAALRRPWPPEGLLVAVSAWCIVSANAQFWHALDVAGAAMGVQFAFGVALVALHALLFGLLAFGRALKPVLCALLVLTACASFFATRYAVLFDVEMIHNVFEKGKDGKEIHADCVFEGADGIILVGRGGSLGSGLTLAFGGVVSGLHGARNRDHDNRQFGVDLGGDALG